MAAPTAQNPAGMRLLGIDPGLQRTGWGVLDVAGNRLTRVAAGVIKTDQSAPTAERLVTIFRALLAVIDDYSPDEAAVEETFVNMNAGSTLKLGLARGVAMLAPAERGLPVAEYSPNAVKKAVTGAGHADKNQIQTMVRHLLPVRDANAEPIGADAADALAIAICHAHHAASRRIIAAGQRAVSA